MINLFIVLHGFYSQRLKTQKVIVFIIFAYSPLSGFIKNPHIHIHTSTNTCYNLSAVTQKLKPDNSHTGFPQFHSQS